LNKGVKTKAAEEDGWSEKQLSYDCKVGEGYDVIIKRKIDDHDMSTSGDTSWLLGPSTGVSWYGME
jgi:hypothetical protein